MKQLMTFLAVISFLFYSCNQKGKDDFLVLKGKMIYHESIETDESECLIGKPSEIIYCNSYLLFSDPYEGKAITVLNVNTKQCVRRFLDIGQGPGEVILPLKLSLSGDKYINIFQIQTGRLYTYDINDIINSASPAPILAQYLFADRPANIVKTANGFTGIGMFEDGRYRLYDETGKISQAIGNYPFRGNSMNQLDRFFLYQGVLCASPDGKHFAFGTSYCDNIEFYRIEKDTVLLVRKYETYDVDGNFNQVVLLSDECVMAYKGACGTSRYCYMLYSGKKFGEQRRRSTGGEKIIVFDWKGTYIRSFESDQTIFWFSVDEKDSTIYAVTRDAKEGSFSIVRYNL